MNVYGSEGTAAPIPSPLRFAYGADPQQFGELYVPNGPGPHPVVLLIHGGFWRAPYDLTLMQGLAEDLAHNGIAAWNIEYRRVGDTGGGWPGTFQDVARAADYLRTLALPYALDLARVISVGHSAGGHLALWLAARPRLPRNSKLTVNSMPLPLSGVVSLAGASDLKHTWELNLGHGAAAELLRGSPASVPDRYMFASPAALLPLGLPQVLIHGDRDDRVPLVVSQEYVHKAAQHGDYTTLVALPRVDHFALIDPSSLAWAITMTHIQKLLVSS